MTSIIDSCYLALTKVTYDQLDSAKAASTLFGSSIRWPPRSFVLQACTASPLPLLYSEQDRKRVSQSDHLSARLPSLLNRHVNIHHDYTLSLHACAAIMVSHPDENRSRSRPPPSRQHRSSVAPQSVVSSRSSTIRGVRHSRYSKSHAGILTPSSSSSASSSNDFPIYTRSGDVEIVLVSGRKEARYLLHKLYLAQSSGWFEEVLGLGDSGTVLSGGSSSSIASVGQRVRFELDQSKADASPMLVLKVRSTPLYRLKLTPCSPIHHAVLTTVSRDLPQFAQNQKFQMASSAQCPTSLPSPSLNHTTYLPTT